MANYHDYDDASDYDDDEDSNYDDVDFRDPDEVMHEQLLQAGGEAINALRGGIPVRNEQNELAQLLELSRKTHEEETLKRLKIEAERRPAPVPIRQPPANDFDEQMRRIMEESMKTLKEDEEKRKNKNVEPVLHQLPPQKPMTQKVERPMSPVNRIVLPTAKTIVVPPREVLIASLPPTVEHEKQTANPPTNKPPLSIIKSYQEKVLQIRGYDEKIKQLDEMFAPKLAEYFETSTIDKIVLDETDSKLYLDTIPFIRISKETRDFFTSIVETNVVTSK